MAYRAQGGAKPVTTSSLAAAIEVMRARSRRLGEDQASFRLAGDEIEVALPGANAADAQESVAKTGQLDLYDWELNVIGRDGAPEPSEGTVTGDLTSQGAGGLDAGLPEYQAVLRAAKRVPMLRSVDTTWSPGCTPRQSGGCLYGSWYLLDTAHEAVLRGPADTMKGLYAGNYAPPTGAKAKAVRVNPGTVLVQAHALENEAGKVTNASPNSWYVLNDNPVLSGTDIIDPEQSTSEFDHQPKVTFGFTPRGRIAFEKVTKALAERGREALHPGVTKEEALQHFAVVLDGQLITVPSIDFTKYPDGISAADGSEIEGGFTVAEARDLAGELQSGAIPVKLELVSRSVVPVLAGQSQSQSQSQISSFGTLAGYVWQGPVRSVQASWTVPRVLPDSSSGVAGTWIGAEAPGGGVSPFIQIGTNEQRDTEPRRPASQTSYDAFWSDVVHHFHPVSLFSVAAGDQVSANMSRAGGRWTLSIVDTSSGARSSFSTSDEGHAPFNEAQWTQEDVTDTTHGKSYPYPYPQLSRVRFRALGANSAAPLYASLRSRWMSLATGDMGPSPLSDDSFTIQPKVVSSLGAQYLRIAQPEDTDETTFLNEIAGWTARTPHSQSASAGSTFAATLRENIQTLASARWPPRAQGLVASLIRATRAALNRVLSLAHVPPAGLAAWRSGFESGTTAIGQAGHAIRRALDLPST